VKQIEILQGAAAVLESKLADKDSVMIVLQVRLDETLKAESLAKDEALAGRQSMELVGHKVGELERQVQVS
jgi:hypothetical protein